MTVNSRFFIKKEISLTEILRVTDAKISDITTIAPSGVNTLSDAVEGNISFFHNMKYKSALKSTRASFVFCEPRHKRYLPNDTIAIEHANPYFAYSVAAAIMYERRTDYGDQVAHTGHGCRISERAVIGKNVIIGNDCFIDSGAVVGDGVVMGDNVTISANTVLGIGVQIGSNSTIDYCVSIECATIGKDCHIYSGVRIGQRGYGFAYDVEKKLVVDVPQLGGVQIGDLVDIGANTTIDRGTINDTIVEAYTKIDNLVHIAHNVKIGQGCSIAAQAGIAGGVEIGALSIIGGQVGIGGHIKIGSNVFIFAQSGVIRDVPDKDKVSGSPAINYLTWFKNNAAAILPPKIDHSKKEDSVFLLTPIKNFFNTMLHKLAERIIRFVIR